MGRPTEATACTGKHRYERASEARRAIESDKRMNVYHCPFCRHFHVGHKFANRARYAGRDRYSLSSGPCLE